MVVFHSSSVFILGTDIMKYRVGKSLPVSVAVWFEQQLEGRGIDSAAVYSRYIISLLQDDTVDLNDIPLEIKVIAKSIIIYFTDNNFFDSLNF